MTEHRRDSFTAFLVAKGRKDGIVSLDSDYGIGTDDVIEACADLTAKQADACLRAAKKILRTDPRDAEIARLNLRVAQLTSGSEAAYLAGRVVDQQHEIGMLLAEVAKRDRALAAGPAALRAKAPRLTWPWSAPGSAYESAAVEVEAAQEAAMKEGK